MKIAKQIYHGVVGTALSEVYAVPTGKKAIVKRIVLINIDTSSHFVSIKIGGIYYIKSRTLTSNETYSFDALVVLNEGDTIQGECSNPNKIYAFIDGAEY